MLLLACMSVIPLWKHQFITGRLLEEDLLLARQVQSDFMWEKKQLSLFQMKGSELSDSSITDCKFHLHDLLDVSVVISLHRWSVSDPTFKAQAFLVFPPVSWRWARHSSFFTPPPISLGTLPADHPQLIAATLWRGCFLSSCSGFYIWAPRPASQEELMGNQSSGVVAALLEIVRTVSRRSPGLSNSLHVFLSVRVHFGTWRPTPPSLFQIISQQ